jgi:hypothetical protein
LVKSLVLLIAENPTYSPFLKNPPASMSNLPSGVESTSIPQATNEPASAIFNAFIIPV